MAEPDRVPFKGANELRLNRQTMKSVLEYWLDNTVLGPTLMPAKVTKVKEVQEEFVVEFEMPGSGDAGG